MAERRAPSRYRGIYARLLLLYPEPFRRRFAPSMQQTFQDLCREREANGKSLFTFALWLCVETAAGGLRERMGPMMPSRKNLIRLALMTGAILAVPLVAMQFADEVGWSVGDFVGAGILLFGSGLVYLTVARRKSGGAYRAAIAMAVATTLLLVWSNLAVGILGSEDNPANGLYLGVLVVGLVGAAAARLRSRGMVRAMVATALTQALVPVVAMLIFEPALSSPTLGTAGLVKGFVVNTLFVLLFVGSAWLFRRASHDSVARA